MQIILGVFVSNSRTWIAIRRTIKHKYICYVLLYGNLVLIYSRIILFYLRIYKFALIFILFIRLNQLNHVQI